MEKKSKISFIGHVLGLVAFAVASMASSSQAASDFHDGFREGYRATTGYDIGQNDVLSDTVIVDDMPLVAISNLNY